jgi:hypothetical protein
MNLRVTITGTALVGLAAAFFLGMTTMAPRSTDPVAMLRAVGQASGGAGGVGLAMIVFGLLRKAPRPATIAAAPAPAVQPRRHQIAAYVPIAVAFGEVLWLVVLVFGLLFAVGDTPYVNTPAKEHMFQVIGALPVVGGLLWGMACMLLRWARGALQWIALLVGFLACAAWCEAFALGYIR